MPFDTGQYTLKREHVVVLNTDVVPFDRSKEVQVRPLREFRLYLAGRETFIRNNDALLDIIITDECRIRTGIDAIPREHLGTDRLHPFYVIGIQHRYFAATSYTGLPGVGRKVLTLLLSCLRVPSIAI